MFREERRECFWQLIANPDLFIYVFILRSVGRYWKYLGPGPFLSPAAHMKLPVGKAEEQSEAV